MGSLRHTLGVAVAVVGLATATAVAQPVAPVTLDEAVRLAVERHPSARQAATTILRAEALLQQARTVAWPTVTGGIATTVLDGERGFDEFVTQPRTQTLFSASVAYPVLAASRWAARTQAGDQVRVAQYGAEEVRRQIAVATAGAYLAVIAQKRQVDVNTRARETAQAHLDYARARLEGGVGSKLNELRAAQEVATSDVLLESARLGVRRAQEALGVLTATDAPVDAAGEPAFEVPAAPVGEDWLRGRTDIRLFTAQREAAERVFRDSRKDWIPTGTVSFDPQYVTPAGLFQPSRTWRGVLQFSVPLFDGGQRRAVARQREVAVEAADLTLAEVELRARADLRTARAAVESTERAVASARLAAQHAADVLRITDVAFRAGATTNIEVIDAQRRARDADTAAAQAEDRLRQARLDLLVALGRFP
ncbi:MAG: TolC family protein [Vicinamibacterales bacterium]|nr:TolC family protein [Vicinamibacterales bacterium]